MSNQDAFDATQRVQLDGDGRPTTPPRPTQPARRPRPTPSQRAAKKRRQQRITLICLVSAALVLLIVLGVVLFNAYNKANADDGKILPNVYVAGVNIGGMTPEQAQAALHAATDHTYSAKDMVVQLDFAVSQDAADVPAGTTLTLTPSQTGAKLDVDAVVQAAYALGRTGTRAQQQQDRKEAESKGITVPVLTYLNLNSKYIQAEINALGAAYSTLLTESTWSFTGTRPDLEQTEYDTTQVWQTLTIKMGTAYYALNTDQLYEQVLNAYDANTFTVSHVCSVQRPKDLDCLAIYEAAGCVEPVDATCDENWNITEEVYGYGFTLEELQNAVNGASFGDVITLDLCFRAPEFTAEFFQGEVFQDTLSYLATKLPGDAAWNNNLQLACQLLNGTIIPAGGEFSFNTVIGEPTLRRGFQTAGIYLGKSFQQVMGGGISQAASTLYYCALKADLEILERHSHSYAVDFIQTGFDAQVYHESMDLRFRNTTDAPIRIEAEVAADELRITLLGTNTKEYNVDLVFTIDQTFLPGTVYNTMTQNNPGGYKNGDVLRPGITGYLVSTYVTRYDKYTGEMMAEETLIVQSYYAMQDQVLVQIEGGAVEPPADEPDGPPATPPTDATDPSDPTVSTDPTDPTVSTDPVEDEEDDD